MRRELVCEGASERVDEWDKELGEFGTSERDARDSDAFVYSTSRNWKGEGKWRKKSEKS